MRNTVDFITFCCPKDLMRLHVKNQLSRRIKSHHHRFNKTILVRQRCRELFSDYRFEVDLEVESEDHPGILSEFNIPEYDRVADDMTHGPNAPHYWKWHVINHLIGLKVSTADYIVFSDCDCRIVVDAALKSSWVTKAIEILEKHDNVLIVSPSDGGEMHEAMLPYGIRLTQNVSQQMFLCNRDRFASIDFNIPWNWEYTAPGGPMQEYYYMLEGRIWRYMHDNNLYRAILPKYWRYWHDQWH